MGDNRSYAALDWVIGEIGETLKQARQSLEAYVENPEDTTRIRFCLTHIHQVHGSLQMVEFYGAALMAEEMEQLAQALMNKSVRNEAEAQEVLMRAILQLPIYLDQVKKNKKDSPTAVLPLLNDLRVVRGEALLTDNKLFTPNLAPAHRIEDKSAAGEIDEPQFTTIVKKLRQMYQYAVAGVIRNVNRDENVAYLLKVFQRLRKLTQKTARQPLWDISLALQEGLASDSIESSATIKNLLRQLDKEIQQLATEGTDCLNEFTNDELIKNLLYYIARAKNDGKYIRRIKELYNLEEALPQKTIGDSQEADDIIAPDLEAIQSVVSALKDELDAIKHSLDISLTDSEHANIAEALPIVKRVADTMAVLGIGDLRKQILAQGQLLESIVDQEEPDSDTLMQVAGKIIEIESALELMASGSDKNADFSQEGLSLSALDQAQETVLRESRNGLEQAKDAIVEYISSKWDKEQLTNVPSQLTGIAGSLEMIPLRKPAAILNSCASYIQEQLVEKGETPEWQTLETLADAIASVEYYLERLCGDRDEEDEMLLSMAEDSVQTLGYPIADSLRSTGYRAGSFAAANPHKLIEDVELPAAPSEKEELDQASQQFDEYAAEAVDLNLDFNLGEVAETDAKEESATDKTISFDEDADKKTELPPVAEVEEDDEDEEPVDEEILEIFVEEAAEVLETINEYFPRWCDNFEDKEALTEFRRGFHTLKGSGRMVKAMDVGELAWSIENMLNRVMDNSVEPNDGHVKVIQTALPLLPEMVSAFEHRQKNPNPALSDKISQWADALSKGDTPDDLFQEDLGLQQSAEPDAHVITLDSDEDDDGPDSVLWEIFASEAVGHLDVVKEYIHEMDASAPMYAPPSDQMQRALHTLKGSAHMADITPIAELVTPLERFVKELRNYQVDIDSDVLQLIKDGVEYTQDVLLQIENNESLEIPKLPQYLARVAELKERHLGPLIRQKEAERNSEQVHAVDPELLSIFMAEEMKLLLDADQLLIGWAHNGQIPESDAHAMVNELEKLEKGSEHAHLPPMATLSHELCEVYRATLDGKLPINQQFVQAVGNGHAELLDMIDAVAVGQDVKAANDETMAQLASLVSAADDLVSTIPTFGGDRAKTVADLSAEVQVPDSAEEYTDAIDDIGVESIEIDIPSVDVVDADDIAESTWDAEVSLSDPEVADAEEAEILSDVAEEIEVDIQLPDIAADVSPSMDDDIVVVVGEDAAEASAEESIEEAAQETDELPEEVDLEILEIFIEEADELLEDIDNAVHDWESDWSDTTQSESLKRSLHTLKGGARLAGIMGLGELAHEFESFLIAKGENVEVDETFFKIVHDYQDKLINGTDKVKARVAGHEPDGLEEVMAATGNVDFDEHETTSTAQAVESNEQESPASVVEDVAEAEVKDDSEKHRAEVLPFTPKAPAKADTGSAPDGGGRGFPGMPAGGQGGGVSQAQAARRSTPQEMVKVSAELLEELVNLAGETSISRGRLEEQNSEINFALDEMESTVGRLQEQLRRLDIETEAQMIFRQEQMEESEDFDPLEMDRYSQLQQLSRSLMESASDLMDLTSTLHDKTRGTETLLLQQSRINTDLQEGLMRSRMVPFSRLVPRLRRIVRQVSTELGKQVSFELDNVEGELDRSVLERMVAPLEHMLRNAVDHGLETSEERVSAGKPETGRIVLSLGREGGDVIMRLADDGRGLNLEKIRAKAIERGLMSEDAILSDHDIMQFILTAGFSTASQVTQISGRGVGMDVVHSEIKQLGGSVTIDSQWGFGTEFEIRLPFTVSVNRALMVQIGDDRYALALNTIEGIVRVSPFELEHYYQDENARFEYAGENYRVRYLGTMLNAENQPRLEGQSMPIPVVLVRTSEHAMAIQVDRLMGSREIVVKSLGPQFSTVPGLSGATVMGDGSVVVILDPHAMIRQEMAIGNARIESLQVEPAQIENNIKNVLVVDDSVTVRKVTTRFLEREGFEVMTAKDGADALMVLQDHIPDVMLLDIEMPRMDGFEVAKNIRSSQRLKDIPIIMITSRTGDKHRERALSLGVNKYLGKPYQEELLLSNINELLDRSTD